MFFFVFGLPGEFTEWCEKVVLALAQHSGDSARLLVADTLEGVALQAIATGVSQAIITSHRPGGRLRQSLIENRRNFLVALDEPHTVLTELVLGRGLDLAGAVQLIASSCGALGAAAKAPGALCLTRSENGGWQRETATAIARHLGFSASAEKLSELVRGIPKGNGDGGPRDGIAWWDGVDDAARELVSGALGPFLDPGTDAPPPSIVWSADLFFLGDRPDERASAPVDITGRARCLLQGPHIVLPAGSWSLSLAASFVQGAVEHDFSVQIFADGLLAEGTITPQAEGHAEVTIDFTITEEMEQPLAVRISSQRAAFDGAISLIGATLTPAPPDNEDPSV